MHAIAVVFAVFFPIITLMGAVFVCCAVGRGLYRMFRHDDTHKPNIKKSDTKQTSTVIPFERRKTSVS
jgi:hypothetical protein